MRIIRKMLYFFTAFFLSCFLIFYFLVISGWAPTMQELWVTSAMTTMSHKWLATAFVDHNTIQEIMNRTIVDDSGHDTIIEDVDDLVNIYESVKDPDKKEPDQELIDSVFKNSYVSEGYTQLDDSLYIKNIQGDTWCGYLMLVSDPSRIRLTQTNQQWTCGQTVMDMVEEAGGVAGINGGGFVDGPNYDSNGGIPAGLLIVDGQLINDVTAGNSPVQNIIGFNTSGQLILRHDTAEWAMENNIYQAVTFSPFLIVNGEGMIKQGTGGWGIAPRTAIGQRADGSVVFLVIDGRQVGYSLGVDIGKLQDILMEEKCVNAAMMDGGSSTVMVHNGSYVNRPANGHERTINNCWVILPEK